MMSRIRDYVTSVVMCGDGSCLVRIADGFVFLISNTTQLPSWKQQALKDIKNATGLDIAFIQLFRWFKVAIPTADFSYSYITSVVYQTQITTEQKTKTVLATGYAWLTFSELQNYFDRRAITNPILLELYPKLTGSNFFKYEAFKGEFLQFGNIVEVTNSCLFVKNTTQSETFVNGTHVKQVQLAVYKDFFSTCLPNVLMSMHHFAVMMNRFGIKGSVVALLFRAADAFNSAFISYRDFACALACVDPSTEHAGNTGDYRTRFIFRMFDKDNDNYLNKMELEAVLAYIRGNGDPDVRNCLETVKWGMPGKKVPIGEFMRGMSVLKLKGLPMACRATKGCQQVYAETAPATADDTDRRTNFATMQTQQVTNHIESDVKAYTIGSHTLRIMKSGQCINVEDIWSLKDACSHNTLQLANITHEARRLSCEVNSPTVIFNEIIKNLRFLTYLNKVRSANRVNKLELYTWGNINDILYGRRLVQVCMSLKKMLLDEKRMIELKSPVYIMGSLLGNYGDLMYFERLLWPRCPGYCPGSILLLGGYVDRVPYGVEIISYLFSYKNLYPHKLHLLRGFHETRKIQMKDCFFEECQKKFGQLLGKEVWDAVNDVFDCLPIAATIDDKLLCVHSGIPSPSAANLTKYINNVPLPLAEPDKNSTVAWEILWNEPLKKTELAVCKTAGDGNNQLADGFTKNLKRGTGYTFTNEALMKYLDTNMCSHLIRTSEPVQNGYALTNKGRLITIFSSSHYGGQANDGACLLADKGKIRAIRLTGKK